MTPWTAARQASLTVTISWSLLKLMSIESVMPSNHLILCRPLLPLPSIFPSIRVFSKESVIHIRWPKYLCFSFSISPSSEYSGLITLRIDCFDLLASRGLSRVFSSSTVWKHQLFGAQSYLWSNSHIHIDYWKNHSFDHTGLGRQSDISAFNMLLDLSQLFLSELKWMGIGEFNSSILSTTVGKNPWE